MKTTNRNTKTNWWTDYEVSYECDNYSPSEWLEIVKNRENATKNVHGWEDVKE